MNNKKIVILGVLAVATTVGAVGGSTLNALQTKAADATLAVNAVPTAQAAAKPATQLDPSKGGHVGANGKKEELLTGTTAEKAKAAALAAVPGGTIERVETDAEGQALSGGEVSPYEAHMTRSDGTRVTVKLDSSFKVTSTENGMH